MPCGPRTSWPTIFPASTSPPSPASTAAVGGREVTKDAFIDMFIDWPLALMIDGEPFIRAATTVVDGGGIQVYMPPIEGLRYTVTRTRDVVEETRRALEAARAELGSISGILGCSCLLRDAQLRNEGRCQAYEEIFTGVPTVSFASYGEVYVSVVSQSSSMILFA